MRKYFCNAVFGIFFVLCAVILLVNGLSAAQQQTDTAKLYAEIAGDYEFVWDMDTRTISFWVEDGKLMGGPPGETPGEIIPVEGDDLKFTVTIPNGEEFILTFIRDDSGKITQCLMGTGMGEALGERIGESSS